MAGVILGSGRLFGASLMIFTELFMCKQHFYHQVSFRVLQCVIFHNLIRDFLCKMWMCHVQLYLCCAAGTPSAPNWGWVSLQTSESVRRNKRTDHRQQLQDRLSGWWAALWQNEEIPQDGHSQLPHSPTGFSEQGRWIVLIKRHYNKLETDALFLCF